MAEEEEARGGSTVGRETTEEEENMESQIKRAMHSRINYFKEQADCLTFESVRRLLENDLGLETYALDVHKRFIKQCLSECMDGADDDYVSMNSRVTVEKKVSSTKGEVAESPVKHQMEKNLLEPSSEDEEKMEDSPVMGLLTGQKTTKSEADELHDIGKKAVPSESTIKKAISKRAAYFKANSEKITIAGVRRLLEEDLELNKNTLDPFKKFISQQVDKVLLPPEASISAKDVKKNSCKKNSQLKLSKHISTEGSSDSLDSESEVVEDEVKSKKIPKGKIQKSEGLKKRKRSVKETKVSSKKQNKLAEETSEENSDAEDGGNVSEDDQSQSSVEKSVKKKEVSAPAYGKQVEHLKSIIKSCGMSVPPSVYKKVKQAPENKREASLIKELEEILSKEGLSTNPSEKEIKEVRKRKQTAKELEGIDMSNIVSSSRRRSTTSFVAPPPPPPPKPKIPVESDDDTEDTDNDDEGEDNDDDDEDDADDGDDSQSEEFNEDEDDSE